MSQAVSPNVPHVVTSLSSSLSMKPLAVAASTIAGVFSSGIGFPFPSVASLGSRLQRKKGVDPGFYAFMITALTTALSDEGRSSYLVVALKTRDESA